MFLDDSEDLVKLLRAIVTKMSWYTLICPFYRNSKNSCPLGSFPQNEYLPSEEFNQDKFFVQLEKRFFIVKSSIKSVI